MFSFRQRIEKDYIETLEERGERDCEAFDNPSFWCKLYQLVNAILNGRRV